MKTQTKRLDEGDYHARMSPQRAQKITDAEGFKVRILKYEEVEGWRIQRYFPRLSVSEFLDLENSEEMLDFPDLDFHAENMSKDGRGQLVAFDW